jgi:Lrp/AsnC family leucine-responsive transcriptional regulator
MAELNADMKAIELIYLQNGKLMAAQDVKRMELARDRLNIELLRHLQDDPRLGVSELARRVGMSAPAVRERVLRLEEASIIRRYSVEIDPAALGYPICAYVRIRPVPGRLQQVADLARRLPQVVECHRVTGEDCFVVKLYLPALEQLDELIDQFLAHGQTTTSLVQSTPVPARDLPLPDSSKIAT